MSVATVYMTEFSDEAALKEVLEYCQKHVKTGYPEAEALIFIQASPSSGVGVVMWPSEEIREEESMAQRAVFTERFGASIKEYLQYWGEVLVKQIKLNFTEVGLLLTPTPVKLLRDSEASSHNPHRIILGQIIKECLNDEIKFF